jgi:UDP-GlcNAc:undecaprenyl-phosphate GlcNAc-1-phosphate transferase
MALLIPILCAAMLVFLTGLIDDVYPLKPFQKLSVELLAAAAVTWACLQARVSLAIPTNAIASSFVTVLWLVICANAFNLIDGLDGLAAGLGLISATALAAVAFLDANITLALVILCLASVLAGFLFYNSNPASIFLGDSGSLTIGFLIGCFTLFNTGRGSGLGALMSVMFVAIPLADIVLAVLRRFLRGNAIFMPDRAHIHHRLLSKGFSCRHAVLGLYITASITSLLAILLLWTRGIWIIFTVTTFLVIVIAGVNTLGYAEFKAIKRILSRPGLLREIKAQLALQVFTEQLASASTPDECWALIQRESHDFGLKPVRMHFAGRAFGEVHAYVPRMAIRVAISDKDWVELASEDRAANFSPTRLGFADSIRNTLEQKRDSAAAPQRRARALSQTA